MVKEKALKWTSQTGKEPYENNSEKNRVLQNATKNNKTTEKKSSYRRRPSWTLKSSTLRTQTSGIFVKQVVLRMVNHHGPLPLKELHSTGETIVWRDPGGSWACLPPVCKCNQPATVCDICGIHPKQHTKKRGALGNTKKKGQTQKKRSWDVGRRSVWKRPKRKHSE